MNVIHRLSAAVLLAGGLSLVPAPAAAHHAFAAEFDKDKPITIEGDLTKVVWMNPHCWVYVDVVDKEGQTVNWAVEFGSPNSLLRRGLRRTDFPPGSKLTVKGFLAKNGRPMVNASIVLLADGRTLYAGSSGTGAPEEPQGEVSRAR